MSKRFRKSKKDDQIFIDDNSHLFLGEGLDLRLLMMRPIDLIEFTEFAGANSEDIVIWVGKTLAKYFIEKLFPGVAWESESLSTKKEAILNVLETFENLGYGQFTALFLKNKILISIENPVTEEEKDNLMAKNICVFFIGIFNGIFELLGFEVDSEEIQCLLKGNEADIFKFNLLTGEFGAEDVDAEVKSKPIASYLERYNI